MSSPPSHDDSHFSGGGLFDHAETKSPANYLVAYVDGGARGNPGPSGFGVMVQDEKGRPVAELSEYLGKQTNNYAEYSGLLAALQYAVQHGQKSLKVFSDSELMVKQIKGQYKVNNPALKELHGKARQLIGGLDSFTITHVLRGKNQDADRLANEAMDRGSGRGPRDDAASSAVREVNGVVRDGVVEFLGTTLPNGTFVKVRAEKP
jgi:ribonuclease HI